MKRLFTIALLALVSFVSFASWAATGPTTANARYSLVVKQGDTLISQADVVATPGTATPFQIGTQHTYIQKACRQTVAAGQSVTTGLAATSSDIISVNDCAGVADAKTTIDGSSTITLVPGTFNTGMTMSLKIAPQSDVVHVRVVLTQLVKMNTFTQDGMTIQLPETTERTVDQSMTLKPAQAVTLLDKGHDGMTVTLTRL